MEVVHKGFTSEQVSLIKSQVADGATDDQLRLFLYQCHRTGLDPLAKQIYCLFRNAKDKDTNRYVKKMVIQTSIDGFRVVAERTGNYAGQDEPVFIEDSTGGLVCAKVPVYRFRGDQRYKAAVGVAYWAEYVPQPGQDTMWRKMPHAMLSKVAEAIALRKAYPQDLSGLYTNDEMAQSADQTTEVVDVVAMEVKDTEGLDMLIDSCETIPELVALYHKHAQSFEQNQEIKQRLSNRKEELRNAKPATA
ncbi:phage recombination protein Bet [Chitinophaga pendula]|uniref:phage recombination protein Bet n=1 Tax=Chitinophaga TaxID=79328 RepID=UPI0012FD5834|nr:MULTISPECIES: phage recombination protein Bet [Chitinophaga]UCJ07811.1 phage recombination protein Bet [Chitinophaga pendula]